MRIERITEWISSGPYAVVVEVEAFIYPNRPGESFVVQKQFAPGKEPYVVERPMS
jgi:hypothetical protein